MKRVVKVFAMVLVLATGHASAQHVPEAERYRISTEGGQSPPRGPIGYWETTWGAIAPSPVGAVLGTAVGAPSKEEAERLALEDCKVKGGTACRVIAVYSNQCGAMIVGSNELYGVSGPTKRKAEKAGIDYCKDSNDTDCRVYYSECTKPIFHKY